MTPAAKAKQPEAVKPEPQKEVRPQPAPAPTAPTPAVATTLGASKPQMTLAKLREAWTAKGIDLSKLEAKVDGKFLNVQVDETWPLIVIGPGGGINLPQIKSYASAWDAAMDAKALLEKQTARAAKPAAPTVVKVTANVVPAADAPKADAVTPAAKKAAQHKQIEDRLQA
ncbi:MAG: hypothetical protein ABSG34_08065 [Candidatus Sulfotelmatobacter sp.]|jgi:hypothetical protein